MTNTVDPPVIITFRAHTFCFGILGPTLDGQVDVLSHIFPMVLTPIHQ